MKNGKILIALPLALRRWYPTRNIKVRGGMSTDSKAPVPKKRKVPAALRPLKYVGIPESVLAWKPRLPSRKWCMFWASLAGLGVVYYDDRRQCKKIMEEYKERVRGLSEQSMHPLEHPRKVLVYTAKYPGDDNYDVGVRFFKRYVKPILVTGAVDYEITSGTSYGNLARELRNRIHQRRRNLAGVEPWTTNTVAGTSLPTTLSPAQYLQRELEGAVVLIGRPALKEWAWALKEGWGTTIPVKPVDFSEKLASELSEDSAFEEITEAATSKSDVSTSTQSHERDSEAALPAVPTVPGRGFSVPTQAGLQSMQGRPPFSPFAIPPSAAQSQSVVTEATSELGSEPEPELPPMSPIPAQPPICFVDFTNLVGFSNIPRRIARFFYRREDVRRGAEAGLSIVLGTKNDAREFQAGDRGTIPRDPPQGHDLDWGLEEEAYYPSTFFKTISNIEKWRKSYYEELRKELKASREIARGIREPTKAEKRDMPKSEIELRGQRFDKEEQWRNSEHGFKILDPAAGVEWDESWRGSLRVLVPRSPDDHVPRRTQEAKDSSGEEASVSS